MNGESCPAVTEDPMKPMTNFEGFPCRLEISFSINLSFITSHEVWVMPAAFKKTGNFLTYMMKGGVYESYMIEFKWRDENIFLFVGVKSKYLPSINYST